MFLSAIFQETEAVKNYVINPVEAREASLEKPTSLVMETVVPDERCDS